MTLQLVALDGCLQIGLKSLKWNSYPFHDCSFPISSVFVNETGNFGRTHNSIEWKLIFKNTQRKSPVNWLDFWETRWQVLFGVSEISIIQSKCTSLDGATLFFVRTWHTHRLQRQSWVRATQNPAFFQFFIIIRTLRTLHGETKLHFVQLSAHTFLVTNCAGEEKFRPENNLPRKIAFDDNAIFL